MLKKDFAGKAPIDIIGMINTGEEILDKTLPFLNGLIASIGEWGNSNSLSTPHGKRMHIEALEATGKLQAQKNAIYDKYDGYFKQLIDKQIITE